MTRSTATLALGLLLAGTGPVVCAQDPSEIPETMQAVRMHAMGGPEVLSLDDDAPVPQPAPGEVLVRVRAAGVNPADWKLREGMFGDVSTLVPLVVGWDISGEVAALGEGVTGFEIGDEVFAYLPGNKPGAYAQYCATPAEVLAHKPERLDHTEAAAVPLACLSAWQALIDGADLQEGQTVLIHGGAGGVGHFAVQIAKWRGATVITTASARNHEFLRSIGADECIDYRSKNFWEVVDDVDVVLDTIGGEVRTNSYRVLKEGGYMMSCVFPEPDPADLERYKVRGSSLRSQGNSEQLTELAALIDQGAITPHVSMALELGEAAKAHEHSESGHTRGKVVLEVP